MKFTDRNKEQERLKNVLERKEHSAFVVLYGRRRLGKSTLIKKTTCFLDRYEYKINTFRFEYMANSESEFSCFAIP